MRDGLHEVGDRFSVPVKDGPDVEAIVIALAMKKDGYTTRVICELPDGKRFEYEREVIVERGEAT